MNAHEIYNSDFVEATIEIKNCLNKTKDLFDEFDQVNPSEQEQIDFIEKNKKEIFAALDDHFAKIWSLAQDFSEEEMQRHRRYYQNQLLPFFEVSPYNKRVYEKPLGYAGDFVMMLYICEDGYEGNSTYAKLIHRYSMNIPAARANRNKKDFFKKQINETLNKFENPKITSIASGPAVEILEVLAENPLAQKAHFTCLDFEILALNYIKEKVEQMDFSFNIDYKHINIHNLLKYEKLKTLFDDQNLIYSYGLIDYFSDKIAAKTIEVLFKKLKRGGKLIVANVSAPNPHRAYLELLGEWFVNYRNEEDLVRLAQRIKENKTVNIEYEKGMKMNIYLVINKP